MVHCTIMGAYGKQSDHTYPGRDHAFARHGGEHYHAADAALAGSRSLAFLRTHLGSA